MDNTSLQRIKDTIARSNTVSIAVSANPTVDQMAAALSLYLTLNSLNKKASVLSPTEAIVELSSLVGIDKVKGATEGSTGDLVVSFPYREGEIEKVSYTIDGGFLNIVVKAGETGLTFSETDVEFKRGADKSDLVFAIGTQTMQDLNVLLSEEALKDVTIVNIDNSDKNEGFGQIVLVSPKFSSLSEQVADLLLNLEMDIDIDAAQNLLAGITSATSNFQSPATSYLAFEIAAILMKRGAVRVQSASLPRREERRDQPHQQQQQPREQRAQRPQEQPRQEVKQDNRGAQKPPSDWLTPKVYKGSTTV
ncbi:MAG: bifunctional oligoribonuclease and phosphatase NrnA [Patescibacteria group bacterium]|jgi:nanoRNase/pAp phosphatase (c-di-AMP/oligoRNAs hydrolase)|nr:bifunctional oligoribonuclease and phosphatase NrnA [Patescibacteria group bacterium]